MIKRIAEELRTVALHCTAFARDCQDGAISEVLEELAADLTAKAFELERRFDR